MSVRRAGRQGRSTTPALPPTLFRLRDLNQRSSAPFDSPLGPSADPTPVESVPTDTAETETPAPQPLAHRETAYAETPPIQPPISMAEGTGAEGHPMTPTGQGTGAAATGEPSPVAQPVSSPAAADAAPADQPAGREWMEMLGSNKGITTMLVLVLIAAWWTHPQDGSDDDAHSVALTNGSAPEDPQTSPTFDEQNLDFDLNDGFEVARQTASPSEVVSASGRTDSRADIAANTVLPAAPDPAAGFDSSAFDTGAFDPVPSATDAFDASAFGNASAMGVAQASSAALPAAPTFSTSQVPVQTVATGTQQGLNGALQEMASNQTFGVNAPASGDQAPDRAMDSPGAADTSAGFRQTSSPNRVDWSRHFPSQP